VIHILDIAGRLALALFMLGVLSLGVALIMPCEQTRHAGRGLRVLGASLATGALALMFWLVLMHSGHAWWHG
jgi:hypothetical protein